MDLAQRLRDLAAKVNSRLQTLFDRVARLQSQIDALPTGGGGGMWGSITGILSAQADLQSALDAKQPTGSYLTSNQSITLSGDATGTGTTAIAVSIASASGSSKGLMSAADFTKLAGVASGATANSADAFLLSRANHTGTQAAATITGLAAVATSGSAADLSTGTLLAARMPAFTGDVTSTVGTVGTTIANGVVTLTKMANMATASLIYRKTAGSGAPEVNSLATLKTDLGLTGTNSGDQTITLSGDVSGSGTGAITTAIGAGKVTLAMQANVAAGTVFYRKTAGAGAPEVQTLATLKTDLAIAESDVANLVTDLAAKAPKANPQFTGVAFYQQPTPSAVNATATLTIAQLLTLIITTTSATAVSLTLPTGTLADAGILSGALPVDEGFEWYTINLGSSSGAVTLVAGTGHTIVGSAAVAIGTSGRWFTRKTATNTFVTYRIS
jgi:hypothetical protein